MRKFGIIVSVIIFFFWSFQQTKKFNSHGSNNYRSVLWADKAGYYVYLPATIIYGYNYNNLPEGLRELYGDGFKDNGSNKLLTKYTYGVSFLNLPFFLLAHISAPFFGYGQTGFNPHYESFMNVGAVFWLIIGLFFSFRFLRKYFDIVPSIVSLAVVFTTTNLYYYAYNETMMSHVYSFALIAMFMYYLKKYIDSGFIQNKALWISAFTFSFIVLIRPTNIIVAMLFLLLDNSLNISSLWLRVKNIMKPKFILVFCVCMVIVFIPQLFYWKFVSGSYLFYSYPGEGFVYWNSPKLLLVLFSTLNGLLPYSPGYIFVFIGIVMMFVFKKANRWIPVLIFILLLYTCASWHSWFFGCSFGMRPFVDFSLIFVIPVAFLIDTVIKKRNVFFSVLFAIAFSYSAYFTIRLSHQYLECFFGDVWDWREYFKFHSKANIFPFKKHSFVWEMENDSSEFLLNSERFVQIQKNGTDKYVTYISKDHLHSAGFVGMFDRFAHNTVKKVHAKFSILTSDPDASIVLATDISDSDSLLYYQSYPLKSVSTDKWNTFYREIELPDYFYLHHVLKIYFYSETQDTIFIDDVSMKFYF